MVMGDHELDHELDECWTLDNGVDGRAGRRIGKLGVVSLVKTFHAPCHQGLHTLLCK